VRLLRKIRYRVTTVLLNASLGSEQYQSVNSRMAWSYDRRELAAVRLLRTAVFECSRSGSRSTVLGVRLRFGLPLPPFCEHLDVPGRSRLTAGSGVSRCLCHHFNVSGYVLNATRVFGTQISSS
jgi:hypothetical protein